MTKHGSLTAWPEKIFITQPTLPSLEGYIENLTEIWDSKWITNNGRFHQKLENLVSDYVGCPHLSLVNNGTQALLLAIASLNLPEGGEIITTPFTFAATTHAIDWMGYTPVFADIDPLTGNICPKSVASLVTPQTRCVLGVHIFGTPCDHEALENICAQHAIPLVYDAAHAFGVKQNGLSLFAIGDVSTVSFHATKLFSTVEGGAVFLNSGKAKLKADQLKNFGILDQDKVIYSGLNMKLSELHAAYGVMTIEQVDQEILHRSRLAEIYLDGLKNLAGIKVVTTGDGFEPNWGFFAIRVNKHDYGNSRDDLFEALKSLNIFTRKYFYPLTSRVPKYSQLPTASDTQLPIANIWESEILCLPIYGGLGKDAALYIVDTIRKLGLEQRL